MWSKWLKIVPWYDVALLVMVLILGGWLWTRGYSAGHDEATRDGKVQLAQLQSRFDTYRRESVEQQNAALKGMVNRYNAQVAAAHKADEDFQAKKQQLERENADLKKQIADVTRRWVDESGKIHPVECVFTRGFVQQYNAALGVTATDSPGHPGTVAAAASGTGKTPRATDTALGRLRDSGVSQADILANVTDNAQQCRVWREQLNGVLDYTEGLH